MLFRVYRHLDEYTRVLKAMRKFIHNLEGETQLEEATAHLYSLYAQLSSAWSTFRLSDLENLAEVSQTSTYSTIPHTHLSVLPTPLPTAPLPHVSNHSTSFSTRRLWTLG